LSTQENPLALGFSLGVELLVGFLQRFLLGLA